MRTYGLIELRHELSRFTDLCDDADDVFKNSQTIVISEGELLAARGIFGLFTEVLDINEAVAYSRDIGQISAL